MKVLIIDDDPDCRLMLTYLLRQGGYDFIEAENGLLGIEAAKQMNPQVILLDYWLEDMTGIECFQLLQKNSSLKNIPVIFCTGKDAKTRQQCIDMGARGIIAKPFSPELFLLEFQRLLED